MNNPACLRQKIRQPPQTIDSEYPNKKSPAAIRGEAMGSTVPP